MWRIYDRGLIYATARVCDASIGWTRIKHGYVGMAQGRQGSYPSDNHAAAPAQQLRSYLHKKCSHVSRHSVAHLFRARWRIFTSIRHGVQDIVRILLFQTCPQLRGRCGCTISDIFPESPRPCRHIPAQARVHPRFVPQTNAGGCVCKKYNHTTIKVPHW